MKIVVCVKQVALFAVRSGVDPVKKRLLSEEVVYAVNPYDEVAVEEALRTRKKFGGRVTALTLGPPRAEAVLRWCLAMGVDEAVHIVGDSPPDRGPWAVSAALAGFLRERKYDLVLCGKVAMDDEMGQTGPILAEWLGLPVVTSVVSVELHPGEGRAILRRTLDRGEREIVECTLPAVFTVDRPLNRPRYPTLPGRRTAERHDIRRIDGSGLLNQPPRGEVLPVVDIVRWAPPRIRPKKILAPGDEVSAAGRMQWVLSGGAGKKAGGRLTGDAGSLADGIIRFLAERGLISRED